mgnify:CR=1 FL=1
MKLQMEGGEDNVEEEKKEEELDASEEVDTDPSIDTGRIEKGEGINVGDIEL